MATPKRRIAGIAASIPAGYVLGRTQGGEGDVGLISITELGQTMVASGAVMGGGAAAVTIAAGTGIGVAGGPAYTISNTGVLSVTAPAAGFAVSGATGAVTFSLNHDLAALEALSSTGLAARTASDTWAQRTITGTSNRLSVTNGDGVSGNPTLDIDSAYVGQTSITTLGTIGTGTWAGTVIAVNHGGTGQTSYTDGQLLIGNTSTGGLTKSTLTAGTNISISNAGGSITITNSAASGNGNFIGRRYLTSSGTYTPTSGTASIIVTAVGGGGAGGGAAATSSVQQAEGSGGGSAGVAQKYMTSSFSGVSYAVGAAGAGSSGAAGGNGGDTTFGTLTASGGVGGALGTATASDGVAGGAGGAAAGGDINIAGKRGWFSSEILNGGSAVSGRGGDTPLGYGSGGEEKAGSSAGVAGTGYGAGGSGAINAASQSARAGGAGTIGTIIIDEYGPPNVIGGSVSGLTAGKVPYATSATALGDSEITDTGGTGGVQVGAPTGGAKGTGTLNATGLYINGTAVGASGTPGAPGLYGPSMSVVPTWTSTGLATWANQVDSTTANIVNGSTGCSLTLAARTLDHWSIRYKAAPATPYSVKILAGALFAPATGGSHINGLALGWYDGTKLYLVRLIQDGSIAGVPFQLYVSKYTNITTWSSNEVTDFQVNTNPLWLEIVDDGTNFTFNYSQNGYDWYGLVTSTKTGSFLGTGGFTNVFFGVQCSSRAAFATIHSYAETSP